MAPPGPLDYAQADACAQQPIAPLAVGLLFTCMWFQKTTPAHNVVTTYALTNSRNRTYNTEGAASGLTYSERRATATLDVWGAIVWGLTRSNPSDASGPRAYSSSPQPCASSPSSTAVAGTVWGSVGERGRRKDAPSMRLLATERATAMLRVFATSRMREEYRDLIIGDHSAEFDAVPVGMLAPTNLAMKARVARWKRPPAATASGTNCPDGMSKRLL